MKKIATLLVLSLSTFAFANTNVYTKTNKALSKKVTKIKKPIELCGVSVTFYDGNGNVTGHRLYTSNQSTLSDCIAWQSGVISSLRSQGYRVTKQLADTNINP